MTPEELAKRGPLIDVEIRRPGGKLGKKGKALIDTGAGRTLISPSLVGELGLVENGFGHARGVDGPVTKKATYEIRFHQPDLDLTGDLTVMAGDNVSGDEVICLLGRDILYDLSFSMSFDGPRGAYSLTMHK